MSEDRWFAAWSKIQQRCAASTTEFDFTLLYPARVVEWEASGINPSGLVGVAFISEPAASKIGTKKGVPVLPPVVGQRYVPLVGSQVLVGWQDGEERYPYATGWLGLGGADTVAHAFSTSYTFEGPLVITKDLRSEHELGHSTGSITATGFAPIVVNATATGSDSEFDVVFDVANMQTLAAGVKIADITLGRDYPQTPKCVVSLVDGVWAAGATVTYAPSGLKSLSLIYQGVSSIAGPQTGIRLTVFVRATA